VLPGERLGSVFCYSGTARWARPGTGPELAGLSGQAFLRRGFAVKETIVPQTGSLCRDAGLGLNRRPVFVRLNLST
jgi:hypothetical protein